MRGIIAPVSVDWLDLVQREGTELFALGRPEQSQASWAEPGDPWFLTTAGSVVARAAFVEHELLSPREAFERFGYASGGLTVEQLTAQLSGERAVAEDELCAFVSLTGLVRLSRPQGARELAALGVALRGDDLVRLSAEQTERLLAA